ncbi:siderophore-iron reductase FhuF [Ewingella americana]|uniref:siderophore-iron reductase FhuF n=1 Tax=Ewingella americana TaxID=41202 RepID=UPI001639923D|nr:siderophore-iron reductase FhuF [Ewingella americana]QMV51503.1 siderophore-iron reductase FhuF [Ewingella americana]
MQTILDSFRDGPISWVADSFKPMTPLVTNALPMSLLTTADGCASVLERYLTLHAEDASHVEKRRARISMWSQWYFANLLPSWVIVSLSHGWQLPIAADNVYLALQDEGLPHQIYLDGPGAAFTSPQPMDRFEEMIEQHLRPVCHAMAEISGLKPGIYWSNAGIRVGWGIKQAELVNADISDGMALLNARELPDGGKNPLFQPMRPENPLDENSPQFRRQCCLRYELADHAMCPSCPLLLAERKSGKKRKSPA